jgi:hypothetical protein
MGPQVQRGQMELQVQRGQMELQVQRVTRAMLVLVRKATRERRERMVQIQTLRSSLFVGRMERQCVQLGYEVLVEELFL